MQKYKYKRGGCERDCTVVGFTTTCTITTKVLNSNTVHGGVYSIQHYVVTFVSNLRMIGGFLWELPPTNKKTIHQTKPELPYTKADAIVRYNICK